MVSYGRVSERLYGGLRATENVVKYKIGGNDNTFLGGLCCLSTFESFLEFLWSWRLVRNVLCIALQFLEYGIKIRH